MTLLLVATNAALILMPTNFPSYRVWVGTNLSQMTCVESNWTLAKYGPSFAVVGAGAFFVRIEP